MTILKNDLLLRALMRQPVEMTPVWLMRQAGRYLPEYRHTRERAGSFLNLCKTPELACEVTLQPLARYPLDAAILFSDILTIPDAMGVGLYFKEGEGPGFKHPLRSKAAIESLGVPDPHQELRYVIEAVTLIRRELGGRVPLIGFSGSPWTLATYMVEGGSTKNFQYVKGLMFDQPQLMHKLLNILAQAITNYLNAQIAAGAQVVMIFDTWGGVLTTRDYREFSLLYLRQIVENVTRQVDHQRIPIILFTKDGNEWLEEIAATGCDAIGLDWKLPIGTVRQRIGQQVALQGNMDPCILYAQPQRIHEEVAIILESFGHGSGHIFNLGHGIHPQTNPDHVALFIEAVHTLSTHYH
jgi:uroporphyrinogen decarboxylase